MSSTDSGPRGAVRKQEATDVSCSGLGHEESAAGFKWQVKGTSSQWCLIPEICLPGTSTDHHAHTLVH